MTRSNSLFATLLLVGASSALSTPGLSDPPAKTSPLTPIPPHSEKAAKLIHIAAGLPLSFETNQGQTNSQVRFLAHSGNSSLFLTPSETVFSLPTATKLAKKTQRLSRHAPNPMKRLALRMQMVGANPKATPLGQQALPGRVNYLIGNDPKKWHTNIPTFARAGFQGVYPGVDVVYYGNHSNLEYDFQVAPHADPRQIALHFAGAQSVRVNANGELLVRIGGRDLRWEKPTVYQQDTQGKHSVTAHFRLKRLSNGQTGVGFALGKYDRARTLVIDPVLLYSTYLAGSTGESASGVAIDSSGHAYVVGNTSSNDFPVTSAGYQQTNPAYPSGNAVFVTKFTPSGSAQVWSTYLGGTVSQSATGIAADSSGNAYVTGQTTSTNFPITPSAYQPTKSSGHSSAFITKINTSGTGLYYSTFLSGSSDDSANAIAIDGSGNAYVTGYALSTNFPVSSGALQPSKPSNALSGYRSGFVTKINSTGTGMVYSTYLGGSQDDYCKGITVDSGGKAYVVGSTRSTNFPVTSGAYQPTHPATLGASNGFVCKLNTTGTAQEYSTYLGGTGQDFPTGVAIDSNYDSYVTGYTSSTDFPTTTGAFQTVNNASSGHYNVFLTKLGATGTSTSLRYSTYLGGTAVGTSSSDSGLGVAVDSSLNAYVTGVTVSTDFPTVQGSFQRVIHGVSGTYTAFVTKFNSAGSTLMYSSFLGGSGLSSGVGDFGTGIAADGNGNVYVVGAAYSTDFPVTAGAFQTTTTGGSGHQRAFVTKLSSFPVFPDVNNDGYTDLLFQDTSNVVYAWYMNGLTVTGGSSISLTPASGYKVVGSGDFTKTGHADLLFQNTSTGALVIWYLNGATYSSGTTISTVPATGYNVVGVADFNRDGWPDILFQNASTGQIVVWFMQGATFLSGQSIASSAPPVVGTGDFNQDGQPDIVVQTVLGSGGIQVNVYYMDEATISSTSSNILFATPNTRVLAVADYNNDGYADLVLNDPTGRSDVYIQFMQNTTKVSNGVISITPPSSYHVVGPH